MLSNTPNESGSNIMKYILAAVCAAVFVSTCTAIAASVDDPAGDKALHDYVLTMDKVKQYEAASTATAAAAASDPSIKAESDKMATEPEKTFADVLVKLDRHARLYAFFAKQGLSKTDAVALPIALMDACSAVEYPQIAAKLASRISQSQIAFCKAHQPELKSMKFFSGGE
ncbi:MAG TPA: hypothetical protein VGK90_14090 [Rhizomicrobium sp.]|jgi:hypothetical protein